MPPTVQIILSLDESAYPCLLVNSPTDDIAREFINRDYWLSLSPILLLGESTTVSFHDLSSAMKPQPMKLAD